MRVALGHISQIYASQLQLHHGLALSFALVVQSKCDILRNGLMWKQNMVLKDQPYRPLFRGWVCDRVSHQLIAEKNGALLHGL